MPDEAQHTETVALVERAQAGDPEAFAALLHLYQDRVVAAATGWLRDPELARDVAQEVFWNAHAALPQLDDGRAFPGWLRRIVRKHCDRVTRRGRLALSAEAPEETSSSEPDAEKSLATRRAAEQLRRAIEALPERERLPVALHYLARESQPRIAEFLELPLSTVKKRLRDARAHLRASALSLDDREPIGFPEDGTGDRENAGTDGSNHTRSHPMTDAMSPLRPSHDERFSDTVRFYLALRQGDRDGVAHILGRHPELVEAEQSWDPGLVTDGVLPFATRATPLITALERGDLAMARLLLERGASPDGPCGCVTGEPPLWAAVVLGRVELVELLLAAGADPNRLAGTGNAPLHVAALRGHDDIAKLLLAHGADPTLRDRQGRSVAELAEQKSSPGLAEQKSSPGLAEQKSSPGLTRTLREGSGAFLASGIKALDLLSPLPRGELVRVHFAAGVGMIVLLLELSQRFVTTKGRVALWSGFTQKPFDAVDLRADLRESGIDGEVEVHLGALDEPPELRRQAFESGLARACALRDQGQEVLLVLLEETGFESDVSASLARVAERVPGAGSITTLVVTTPVSRFEPASPLEAPFSARLAFDRRRATRILFPALDPRHTESRALCDDITGERHVRVAIAARKLLADYEAVDPELALPAPEAIDPATRETAHRGQRLLRFLSQPFLTTEPFTGHIARPIGMAVVLDGVEAILRGEDLPSGDDELVKLTPGPR